MNICKHNDFCGGCTHQGVEYSRQLEIKNEEVLALLKEKNIHYDKYFDIEASPKLFGYRNKMEFTFGNMAKDGEMTLGMHQKGRFMSIVTVDECQLVDQDFNTILKEVLEFCNMKEYTHYHKKLHTGFVRNLIIRKGERTKELLINLVTSSQNQLDEKDFVDLLLNLSLNNKIVGIVHTINDRVADFAYCDSLKVLHGQDYYSEKIMGLDFKVSAFSFFQTNVEAVERLYKEALSLIDNFDDKIVYDLYCGTGTITQTLALKAKKVIGVEIIEEAVDAARINAKLNRLDNCEFIAGDVFDVLDSIEEQPDVIVVDPPRVGIHQKALEKIVSYGVKQILYISCNPKSLTDNLKYMNYYGYEVKTIKAYDNFPNTKHVETVVLMSREDK
ncbi:MAG: 23S rRNA (uracil(1939)-C(5))-methyltransferase RlmD [Peptostreptococcaceae bacterium]|nr:23S rRNA (uracil(1939)-C(5))-methyltransferase RlmD [Peptostreptococcaceae bacterium]